MGDLSADNSDVSEGVDRWVPTIGSTSAPVRDSFAPATATLVANIYQHIEAQRSQALSALLQDDHQNMRGDHVLPDVSAYACVR